MLQTGHFTEATSNFFKQQELRRMKWESNRVMPRTTYRRSVSKERWVETLVVADSKMIEYHGSENVESYILTIINMQELKITHHADKTLASFCKWQKSINPKLDTNPLHHDVAVLLTRKDICAAMNQPCETLGLSHLSGMCQPHRSCNINEDSGLPLAFTIAHELGHSHGWGFCLDDVPKKKDLKPPFIAPGVIYDVHHQCQLQYGPNATFCDQVDNICQTLWCFVKGSCRSKLDAAADGTRCGENKWCLSGECITVGKSPEAINGAWGSWSSWSHCTRTCGAGIQAAERHCNNPEPQFGGKYCTGERKRYHMCNVKGCQKTTPNFRQMQCSEFDTVAYKNEFYQWIPVYNKGYVDIGLIPKGARHIKVVEVSEAGNFLALRSEDPQKYYLNGGFIIQWNGDYEVAGTIFKYGRKGDLENLTASGPTNESLWLQENNPGIKYEYTVRKGSSLENEVEEPEYFWKYGKWTSCSVTCGNGFQRQIAHCVKREKSMVKNLFCDPETQPKAKQKKCTEKDCPPRWWAGEWQKCSTTCGPTGEKKRTVLCIQKLGFDEQALPVEECQHLLKPKTRLSCNRDISCPSDWTVSNWTECSTTCGVGAFWRLVECNTKNQSDCQHIKKPDPARRCYLRPCAQWRVGNWSKCSASCGGGTQERAVQCISVDGHATKEENWCEQETKPPDSQECNLQKCVKSTGSSCSKDRLSVNFCERALRCSPPPVSAEAGSAFC
ncbi:A disintegrin and metalloproteinase with thrombospondin motifs 12 [Crotalus adamanteus]|uniref:A disintegrin and metalloproteinase with thrombospondin motifs 12 n=1 Tax=Crotalus adamanteus TaxID=8729 RepID=A0AAW1C238_CROAD